MDIATLYALAEQENIPIYPFPMAENGSMSLMDEEGNCCVGMDPGVLDGGTRERVHLAHELGHCLTGSFYNRWAAVDSRQRHENRANKWAVRQLVPLSALDDAIAGGCTQIWELAEAFGVTESFMRKAVSYYVHGNLATELYF